MSKKTLLIKLQNLQLRSKSNYEFTYYSFSISQTMYFSSCFDEKTQALTDDILIPLPDSLPNTLDLQRWENHMIMFTHTIDISELKSRKSTKKRYETKGGQILSFTIIVLNEEQLIFTNKFMKSISQHYLIISDLKIQNQKKSKKTQGGPSFFIVRTSQNDLVLPIIDGQLCIKLPQTLQFEHIKGGVCCGNTKVLKSDELTNSTPIFPLVVDGKVKNRITMQLKWVTNVQEAKAQNTLLLQAHELLIYDMEVKFENANEFANCRVKFGYGNKGFEIGNQFNSAKAIKIKKIIYFIIKSEEQQVKIIVQKNMKVISLNNFYTGDIQSYSVNTIKKKLIDMNGKQIGFIKFRVQKAKSLSTPLNNKFWKDNIKKKTLNSATLAIQQASVHYEKEDDLSIVVKTQNQEWVIPDIPNLQFFNPWKEIAIEPVVVNAKYEESMYLMVKYADSPQNRQINQGDFIGIAILNIAQLRMGMNSIEVPCFKNQQKTVVINCLINKVIPYPFIKSLFQPEQLASRTHKLLNLKLFLKKVMFTPFYYTFRYDKKNEVYCIAQINGIKKVLIMESSINNDLHFVLSAGSDNLNFIIESSDFLKIKIVCLISDIGQQEQIYGSLVVKTKTQDVSPHPPLQFNKIQLKNQFQTVVGTFNFEITKKQHQHEEAITQKSSLRGDFRVGKKTLQSRQSRDYSIERTKVKTKSINPIRNSSHNQSLDLKSLLNKSPSKYEKDYSFNSPQNYQNQESLKLPVIKQSKKNGLKELVHLMKVRKRGVKGYDEINTVQSYHKPPVSDRFSKKQVGISKIQKQNPNLERNLQILFPSKKPDPRERYEKRQRLNIYEDELKGLKSVYQEISKDMGEIEPSYKDSKESRERGNTINYQDHEWEGNQFAEMDV